MDTSGAAQVRLGERQNISFDTLYISSEEFEEVDKRISDICPPSLAFHIVDFGGGNGRFADILLSRFPNAVVHNVDISRELLARNTQHPRKRIVAESLLNYRPEEAIHVVFFNYVLHHLVSASLEETRKLIGAALRHARDLLAENGKIVVFENILVGLLSDRLSSELLFQATSSRLLAPITARLGANTAGVGVYYMGADELLGTAAAQGLALQGSFCLRQPQRGPRIWPCLAKARLRPCYLFSRAPLPS